MGCGAALGGLIGGRLDEIVGWRVAFLVRLPFILLGPVLCTGAHDIPSRPANSKPEERGIDYAGSVALVLSVSSLLIGLNSGGNQVLRAHPHGRLRNHVLHSHLPAASK